MGHGIQRSMGKEMKVAITGHTRGIGKAFKEKFEQNGHEVLGFSSSTGFDISVAGNRERIFRIAKDCDVFINNAYVTAGQTELLKKFISEWEGQNKLIINISSKSVFLTEPPPWFQEYVTNKKEQNKIIESRMRSGFPKVMNVLLGVVATDLSGMFQSNKIDPEEIAELVVDTLKYKSMAVQELIIDVPGLDWQDIKLINDN